jgi:hypothetical protein
MLFVALSAAFVYLWKKMSQFYIYLAIKPVNEKQHSSPESHLFLLVSVKNGPFKGQKHPLSIGNEHLTFKRPAFVLMDFPFWY